MCAAPWAGERYCPVNDADAQFYDFQLRNRAAETLRDFAVGALGLPETRGNAYAAAHPRCSNPYYIHLSGRAPPASCTAGSDGGDGDNSRIIEGGGGDGSRRLDGNKDDDVSGASGSRGDSGSRPGGSGASNNHNDQKRERGSDEHSGGAAVYENAKLFLAAGFALPHLPWRVPQELWEFHATRSHDRSTRAARRIADSYPLNATVALPVDAPPVAWNLPYAMTHMLRVDGSTIKPPSLDAPFAPKVQHELAVSYYAACSFVDTQVGALVDVLDGELGVADETVLLLVEYRRFENKER